MKEIHILQVKDSTPLQQGQACKGLGLIQVKGTEPLETKVEDKGGPQVDPFSLMTHIRGLSQAEVTNLLERGCAALELKDESVQDEAYRLRDQIYYSKIDCHRLGVKGRDYSHLPGKARDRVRLYSIAATLGGIEKIPE